MPPRSASRVALPPPLKLRLSAHNQRPAAPSRAPHPAHRPRNLPIPNATSAGGDSPADLPPPPTEADDGPTEIEAAHPQESEEEVFRRVVDHVFPDEMDWKTFWETDDYDDWHVKWAEALGREGGFDVTDPKREAMDARQMEWLYRAVPYMAKHREDFAQFLPTNWQKHMMEEEPEPEFVRPERNPEMSAWDLRAMMEKRRLRERRHRDWQRRMDEVGKFRYYDLIMRDKRIPDEDKEQYTTWSEEDIWNLITQNGMAVDPRELGDDVYIEEDPLAPADYPIPYQDEIEEFLRKEGRIVDRDSEVDLNSEITLLSKDFKDFEQGVSGGGME